MDYGTYEVQYRKLSVLPKPWLDYRGTYVLYIHKSLGFPAPRTFTPSKNDASRYSKYDLFSFWDDYQGDGYSSQRLVVHRGLSYIHLGSYCYIVYAN